MTSRGDALPKCDPIDAASQAVIEARRQRVNAPTTASMVISAYEAARALNPAPAMGAPSPAQIINHLWGALYGIAHSGPVNEAGEPDADAAWSWCYDRANDAIEWLESKGVTFPTRAMSAAPPEEVDPPIDPDAGKCAGGVKVPWGACPKCGATADSSCPYDKLHPITRRPAPQAEGGE